MKPRSMLSLLLALGLVAIAVSAQAQATNLLISEYVEGSGNNKAIEIYNGTTDAINLGSYSIARYSNGSTVPFSIALNAVDLAPGRTFVIAHSQAAPTLLASANQTNVNLNFDGNDALVLFYGGTTVIDSFGRVGEDPGTAWSCGSGSTVNHTMRRISSVCTGDITFGDFFDPCVGYVFFAVDVFSGLGTHVAACGAVGDTNPNWGTFKATFR